MDRSSFIRDVMFAFLVVGLSGAIGIAYNIAAPWGLSPFSTYKGYGKPPAPSEQEPNPLPPVGLHEPMDVARAMSVLDRAVFVDARSFEDYERGHVPGAVSVPYSLKRLMPREQGGGYTEEELKPLRSACVVVVYDSGDGSAESLHADLKSKLPVFHVLKGGVQAWRSANGPWWSPAR